MSDSGSSDGEGTNQAFEALNGFDDDMLGGGAPPKIEEHIFFATLSEKHPVYKFEGCDDAESTLILRRATLDEKCEDAGRHVIQAISLDHADNRTSGTLCSLKLDGNCTVALDGICVAPPTAFKLVKGAGPLTICGNLMKEVDQDLMPEDELDSDNSVEEEMEDASEEETPALTPDAINAKIKSIKEASPKAKSAKRKPADDESTDSEVEEEPTPKKKAKVNGTASSQDSAVSVEGDSKPEKKVVKEKKEIIKFDTAEALIAAVKAYKGGRPKKQAKFTKWVKNTMRCDNTDFIEKAWTACGQS